ncbi:hypothetical protein BJF83_13580 [Nocardiopsis sp. CNR-923]|uniref:hypothetical protein n=1 Tax=Nocardiopsis sp. CNR-923 TaxID=1904965 RepID=UPI00096794D4|nr:hypothetical protein [Nocardiopsis sp. CNR-923]OLT28829.1 hypothetical protein BJF83_13580 [Nocardiopsis sp. CNR-923]
MTRDHPVRAEPTTPLPGPRSATAEDAADGSSPRRWSLPAVSGVVTVVLAVALWWWASALGAPSTIIGPDTREAERNPLGQDVETTSTASDGRPAAEPTEQDGDQPHEPRTGDHPGQGAKPSEHAHQDSGQEHGGQSGQSGQDAAPPSATHSAAPTDGPSTPSPQEGEGAYGSQSAEEDAAADPAGEGAGGGFLDGLLGLLLGDG